MYSSASLHNIDAVVVAVIIPGGGNGVPASLACSEQSNTLAMSLKRKLFTYLYPCEAGLAKCENVPLPESFSSFQTMLHSQLPSFVAHTTTGQQISAANYGALQPGVEMIMTPGDPLPPGRNVALLMYTQCLTVADFTLEAVRRALFLPRSMKEEQGKSH